MSVIANKVITHKNNTLNIIADIGGTNMRVAVAEDNGDINNIAVYTCADYASLADVLSDYIAKQAFGGVTINACLAIACPVEQDIVSMTNLPWQFSQSALKAKLNFTNLWLINDFTAIAYAVPKLDKQQKVQIGHGQSLADKPIAICGPGTGLGVASLVPNNGDWSCLSGEGGHADFAPNDSQEIAILEFLMKKYAHVSYEQVLSGQGLEQIYQALTFIKEGFDSTLSAKEITEKALAGSCDICQETLAQFCRFLGSFAGNLALTLGSHGGVYIAGGIVPRFIDYFTHSDFRTRFDQKGRLSNFVNTIATYVITEQQPGLIGAAAYLNQLSAVNTVEI